MANRRNFLQSSIALSAVALPGPSALAASMRLGGEAVIRLERFVYDDRFVEAVDTARHAARLGVPLAAVSGDLTRLWYDDLDLRWKKAPMALAGITTSAELFVLETLAADRGIALRSSAAGPSTRIAARRATATGAATTGARCCPAPKRFRSSTAGRCQRFSSNAAI